MRHARLLTPMLACAGLACVGLACFGLACANPEPPPPTKPETSHVKIAPDVSTRLAQFAPVELKADLSGLSAEDLAVAAPLVEAARVIDGIFLRQAYGGNEALGSALLGEDGPLGKSARAYFVLNAGPFDRLDAFKPFLGEAKHPDGAGYYPEDLTKAEMERWLNEHPNDKAAFESLTTVIERRDGRLVAVPYSQAYRDELERAAVLLRDAASKTSNASLKRFLTSRAAAFGTDDYFASDIDWMDLDANLEVVIGPYETYEDSLFGYKAAFEAYVTATLPKESAALARYKGELPWLERNLPIPDEHKNPNRGTDSPIRVVDLLAAGGDAATGIPAIAFNLPNDERVREAKGSKKVLMRNLMRAKFDEVLQPIAERTIASDQVTKVSFEAFFEEVLHHELSHGLGPGLILKDGKKTDVRLELKELYSTLEEAKADVAGVYNLLALMDKGVVDAALRENLYPTYVAGLFRSARFGLHEAHGRGVVAQFNYLLAKGALAVDAGGRFRAVPEKFPAGIRELLGEILMIQAKGDYAAATAFLDRYGVATPELEAAIARLADVPVDVRISYPKL